MIAKLTGDVLHRGAGYVILETSGVGYKVTLPDLAAHGLRGQVELFIHEAQRDDGRELFGFLTLEALELFWEFAGVSGVGPKTAQKIVYAGTVADVKARIAAGDLAFLSAVPGVGKKTAQKIVLELKGTLADALGESNAPLDQDALEALLSLGYPRQDIESVLTHIEAPSTEARVRLALQHLSRS